jgi:hypothetical protein
MAILAQTIHDGLVGKLGSNTLTYVTVSKDLHRAEFCTTKVPSNPDVSLPCLDDSDKALLAVVEEELFSSVG